MTKFYFTESQSFVEYIRRFFVYFGCFRLFLEWSVRGKSNE